MWLILLFSSEYDHIFIMKQTHNVKFKTHKYNKYANWFHRDTNTINAINKLVYIVYFMHILKLNGTWKLLKQNVY